MRGRQSREECQGMGLALVASTFFLPKTSNFKTASAVASNVMVRVDT